MKILQVIPFFSPKFGGSVTVPYELSKELAKRNHDITIITTDFGFNLDYADVIRANGVTVIPFRCVANFGLFLYSPSMKIWLKKNLKNYDIIHLHNYRSYQNNLVHILAMKFGIPYIVQAHGSVLPLFERQNLKKLYDFVWGKKILKDASKVIALTEIEADQYQKMGVPRDKIEEIPNGLDLSQFLHNPGRGDFRSKYKIPENDKIILFLGRIHRIKGIDLLIAAYSELLKELPECQLVIVGPDDNYLSIIEDQIIKLEIKKKPIFTGLLFGAGKISAYTDADVFVLPSDYESFPIVLLEAMFYEIPVIITKNLKHFDWIDNKTGFICNRDPEDLKKHLSILLKDEKLRQSFGANGKIIVREYFDFQNTVQTVIDLYNKLT